LNLLTEPKPTPFVILGVQLRCSYVILQLQEREKFSLLEQYDWGSKLKWSIVSLFVLMLFCVACDTSVAPIVSIKIVTPSATVYTNGSVNVQVAFAGSPNTVALLKNGEVLANLSAPYAYTWNTTVEPEGDYSLSARATLSSGTVVVSDPVVIHVDRTSPTLLTQAPQADMQAVDPGVTLIDTFSEAIAPLSVTPANFQVKQKDKGLRLVVESAYPYDPTLGGALPRNDNRARFSTILRKVSNGESLRKPSHSRR
jgi:hypothetical protein